MNSYSLECKEIKNSLKNLGFIFDLRIGQLSTEVELLLSRQYQECWEELEWKRIQFPTQDAIGLKEKAWVSSDDSMSKIEAVTYWASEAKPAVKSLTFEVEIFFNFVLTLDSIKAVQTSKSKVTPQSSICAKTNFGKKVKMEQLHYPNLPGISPKTSSTASECILSQIFRFISPSPFLDIIEANLAQPRALAWIPALETSAFLKSNEL